MSNPRPSMLSRLLPRTMASRLYLILFTGLLVAHGLSFGMLFLERYESATSMMMGNLEKDVSTSIAMLDRLPAAERPAWVPKFERRTYRYILGPGQSGDELKTERARDLTHLIGGALGPRYPVRGNTTSLKPEQVQVHVQLSDGAPVTIELTPSVMPIAQWLPYVLAAQLILLLACAWLAVRQITRPLAQLADAADSLSPTGGSPHLPEGGPVEVAKAVSAFNSMQDRIALHLKERLQILAAISHDLQTPITRMKLRVETMDESPASGKLLADLDEMQHLVRDGVAYARSAHGGIEPAIKVDLDAFLDSLVWDYQDTGKPVSLITHASVPVITRPRALRRVVGNLIDNAVKYAGAAEVAASVEADGAVAITVMDRGPGIAEAELASVLEPFYRVEASRNRDTGGAGLGLAIAQQLAIAIGARLQLRGREGGGLVATITLPHG